MLKSIDAIPVMNAGTEAASLTRGQCAGVADDGSYLVLCPDAAWPIACDALIAFLASVEVGDEVLVWRPDASVGSRPVLIGKIGRAVLGDAAQVVELVAQQALTLRCGASSLEMKSDGKVLIKGDDVTVKAKGTQRIRAGSVSIN